MCTFEGDCGPILFFDHRVINRGRIPMQWGNARAAFRTRDSYRIRSSTRFEPCPREIHPQNLCVPVHLSAWNTSPPLANSKAGPQRAPFPPENPPEIDFGAFSAILRGVGGLNFAQNRSPALRKSIFGNYILDYNLAGRRRKALAEVA